MSKKEKLLNYLINDVSDTELIDIHNDYCNKVKQWDNRIYSMYDFDEMFKGTAPSTVAVKIQGGSYDPAHDYFTFDEFGNIITFADYSIKFHISYFDIINYIIENQDDFDINDICYILTFEEEVSENVGND